MSKAGELMERRILLARAMGWTRHPIAPDGQVPVWISTHGDVRSNVPNPYTRADDCLALLEWARGQEWCDRIEIYQDGVALFGYRREDKPRYTSTEESLLNALPNAIVAALQSLKENGE